MCRPLCLPNAQHCSKAYAPDLVQDLVLGQEPLPDPLPAVESQSQSTVDDDSSDSEDESSLFFCREEGCTRSFQRLSSLQKHLDYGSHKYALERETLYDKAMLGYAAKLEQGATAEVPEIPTADIHLEQPHESVLQKGWALKSTKQRKRLSEKQKKYLLNVYQIGESTGHKAEPASVAKSMRMSKNSDGSLLFDASEFLTPQQIANIFHVYQQRGSCLPTMELRTRFKRI